MPAFLVQFLVTAHLSEFQAPQLEHIMAPRHVASEQGSEAAAALRQG